MTTPTHRKDMDLTWLIEDRVHLAGFDCAALRALRTLKAVFGMMPGGPRIEFWQRGNTNPAKVKCIDCWCESPAVHATFTPYVVIKLRVTRP